MVAAANAVIHEAVNANVTMATLLLALAPHMADNADNGKCDGNIDNEGDGSGYYCGDSSEWRIWLK